MPKSEALSECEILEAVHKLVPRGLPERIRPDICQEMIVAILTGESSFTKLQADPARFTKQYLRDNSERYGVISLDSPDDEGKSFMERVGL